MPDLVLEHLTIQALSGATLVDDLSLTIPSERAVGLVGESGSGKSLTLRAILGLLPDGVQAVAGSITYGERCIEVSDVSSLQKMGGRKISMIFQDSSSSLNPVLRVRDQITDSLRLVGGQSKREAENGCMNLLADMGFEDPTSVAQKYPSELSGGMRQRIGIAAAIALSPSLILCDEPTTALDVITQRQILMLIRSLCSKHHTSLLYVSHDLSVVANICDSVSVMKAGKLVESGNLSDIFRHPQEKYTRALIEAVPRIPKQWRQTPEQTEPLLQVHELTKVYGAGYSPRKNPGTEVLHGVSFDVPFHQIVGLIGGSGSGKSTVARIVSGLELPSAGSLRFAGDELPGHRKRGNLRDIQMIFQDPSTSLDPSRTIREMLCEVIRVNRLAPHQHELEFAEEILDQVSLPRQLAERRPAQLSGGQRQRAAIARALVFRPRLLIADEPTSALDVTTQARLLTLFSDLRERLGVTLLYISHNLESIATLCDRLVILHRGEVVEQGITQEIFQHPSNDYTKTLLEAILTNQIPVAQ